MLKKCVQGQKAIQQQIHDIHEREAWTRGRFEDHEAYQEANTEFQEWVRKRFEDHEAYQNANTEFQEWVRKRFEDHEAYQEANTEFQEWMRNHIKNDEVYRSINTEFQEWVKEKIVWITEHMGMAQQMEDDMPAGNIDIQRNIYNKKTYSQSGEDAIISYVLNFIGIDFKNIRYLELGANHAKEMSNSYAYYENGASGVLVEANPELIDELKRMRPRDIILNKAIMTGGEKEAEFYVMSGDGLSTVSYEAAAAAMKANPDITVKAKYIVQTVTLEELISCYFKTGLDILSIDLEGIEEKILEGYDFGICRPTVIILENIPYRPYLVIEEREDKAGKLLRKNGYLEYAFTGINSIYLDKLEICRKNRNIMKNMGLE